jgi:hypothetical protein
LRLSDADREQLYELLSQHAAAGRITLEELERRVAEVSAARSHSDVAAVLDDLPPIPAGLPARRWPARAAHGEADAPSAGWRPTNERFRDPRTQRIMRVWTDSEGGRHYVPDAPG